MTEVKYLLIAPILILAAAAGSPARLNAQGNSSNHSQDLDHDRGDSHDRDNRFRFVPGSLVVSRSVYDGNASTVTTGETLPLGCQGGTTGLTINVPTTTGGTTPVTVPCGVATDNGEYPNLFDTHNVWNNANSDGSFGVTSPIFLDDITTDGRELGTLPIPSDKIVTSFSSKSELALNRSVDGRSITFMGYVGGIGCGGVAVSPTAPNLLDASASNTPGVCDPTNPVFTTFTSNPFVPAAYYRSVAEVDADGQLSITHGNAYSGDNGRAAIKGGNGLYYMVGNDNSGNLSKKQMSTTTDGIDLSNATGAELLYPGLMPPLPPNIEMIGRLELGTDKPGKDTNFRSLTIFNNTLYVTKGSGGNGINTVYQAGTVGTLPTGSVATLATVPLTILPGFPNTAASTNTAFPFGIWFANPTTLYVCDEGDGTLVSPAVNGNVADAQSLATAGLQKWSLINGTWGMQYVLQDGLNIGVPYRIGGYPSSLNPATGGCRNITGRDNFDGTVTIFAITSTISANGDTGADPNKLVKVTDRISDTTLPKGDDRLGHFTTVRSARSHEVLRGVTFAPGGYGW
ncbi:hypothetical protein P8936_09560 [Edaphobacter paludis]|uniref:DUF839 domain-containing protein n=1 Tax=Edaphobacter paludis TaxID=3035702 RepID=A0AAU7D3E6_9BACT